jgi:peptidoglycan hydrolase CwlO-like protein
MSMPLEVRDQPYVRSVKSDQPKKKHTYKILFAAWVFLIACGVMGTKVYSDHLRSQIADKINTDTKLQLDSIQKDYQAQVSDLKTTVQSEMSQLQTKVDALTELLAFTKDSANSKTDSSNQLYTQLSDLKKKLEELEKNLDGLK